MRWGLQQSNNWISAYLINLLGPSQFVNILHDFGLNNPDIDKYASPVLCLGPSEASVGEMTSAYTTFANGGIRCAPLFVTKIEDSHGNVIAKFQPLMTEVISEVSSYQMIDMLRALYKEVLPADCVLRIILTSTWEVKQVQQITMQMVGLWL